MLWKNNFKTGSFSACCLVIKWEGKPIAVSISTERLTRIEFHEVPRSVFLSRSDIAVEKEDRSLYVRALTPDVEDTLFVVGESGTTYELNLSVLIVVVQLAVAVMAEAQQPTKVPRISYLSGSEYEDRSINGPI